MYAEQMEKFGFIPANHVQPEWFPVAIEPVYDGQGRVVPGYKRVERKDSGDTMAVHTSKYALIPYETQFSAFDRQLANSGLDLTEMAIATDLTHNGARCFRQYVLPAYTIVMPNHRNLALRFIMFGSYDGSSSFHGRVGAFDFVCANTSVLGKTILEKRVRHTGTDEDVAERIDGAVELLVEAAEAYLANADRLKRWPLINIDLHEARKLFKALPQSNETLADHFTGRFLDQGIMNLWGVWNVLTTWSSHPTTKSNRASVSADREKRVTSLVEGRDWKVYDPALAVAAE